MTGQIWAVTFACAHGADVLNWQVELRSDERGALERDLSWLFKLGHLVGFSVMPVTPPITTVEFRARMVAQFGELVIDAIDGCPIVSPEPPAAYLATVAPFEENEHGVIASSLRLLNTEAEVLALPSFGDELGFPLAGRPGLYLPLILPYPNWRASSVI